MHIIGGKHKKRRLFTPNTEKVRPTSGSLREAVFNICQLHIEGALFLDLFAGSGAMGLEALSRGAKHATFVEKNKSALASLKKNIASLQEEKQSTVLALDVFDALEKLFKRKTQFDLIYADPPYGTKEFSLSPGVIQAIDQMNLLASGGLLFIEDAVDARMEPIDLKSFEILKERKFGRALLRIYKSVI